MSANSNSVHDAIERNIGLLIVLVVLVVSVGGSVEIVPLFFQKSTTQPVAGLQPSPAGISTSARAAATAIPR
jgi:cytochrome c oxidase cbb3-type subunit 2